MPVVTRSQRRQLVQRLFKEATAIPRVLWRIVEDLPGKDLVSLRQVSKDALLKAVVDRRWRRELKQRKARVAKLVKKVNNYLTHLRSIGERFHGRRRMDEQLRVVNRLFQYLCANRWFVDGHARFAEKVHDKLFEFASRHPTFTENGVRYLVKLFDLAPPEKGLSEYGMIDKNGAFVELPK